MDAAADSTVDDDLEVTADGFDDRLERVDGRRREIELPAAVIREHDRGRAGAARSLRVGGRHDALDRKRPTPLLDHPLRVRPRDAAVELIVEVLDDAAELVAAGRRPMRDIGHLDLRRRQMTVHPTRMHRDVEKAHERELRRHGHAGHDIALAVAGDGHVDGELQRLEPGRTRALDELAREPAILEHIHLKRLRAGALLRDFFDRHRREARQRVERTRSMRGARDRALAFVVEQARQSRGRA